MLDTMMEAATSFLVNFPYDTGREKFSTVTDTKKVEMIGSVSEFHERTHVLSPGSKVIVKGTLSKCLPIFSGETATKRDLYSEFKKSVEQHREKTLDCLLSLLAGQMIVHPRCDNDSPYIPCALYESTVRNSVLVLIHKDVYARISRVMQEESPNPNFAEVRITGIVDVVENPFVQCIGNVLSSCKAIGQVVDMGKLQSLTKTRVIYLQDDGVGKFHYDSAPRFLYGDIWLSIQRKTEGKLLTRFLNLSNYKEMLQQADNMVSECQQQFSGWNITGSYCHFPEKSRR